MIKKEVSCVICGEFEADDIWLFPPVQECNIIANRNNEPTLLKHLRQHSSEASILLRGEMTKYADGDIMIVLRSNYPEEESKKVDIETVVSKVMKTAELYAEDIKESRSRISDKENVNTWFGMMGI